MNVTVIDIGVEQQHKTAKGGYTSIEVTYKDDNNKVSNKKLMSFGNAGVYKTFKGATKGQVYSVTSVKDDAGYWQWTEASLAGSVGNSENTGGQVGSGSKTSTSGSTYATKEERAATQVLICKQNALTNAANLLKSDKKVPTAKEVTELAQELANWTLGVDAPTLPDFSDFPDDIPT